MEKAVLLCQCLDRKGIVARISGFLFNHGANIVQADQHSTDPEHGQFFFRVEFCFDPQKISREALEKNFTEIAEEMNLHWQIHYSDNIMNMAILVSKQDHCLFDLLYRWRSGELNVHIPVVISNHEDLKGLVEQYGVEFLCVPVRKENREEKEKEVLAIIKDRSDFLVLARYMQILSPEFLSEYKKPIINIHHSFLPSFKGAEPYRQAYDRGVKIIGASAHYVTEVLDEGPIIEQVVERVSHRDDVEALKRKGRNLEKVALSNAIHTHIEHRIIRYRNKTIVFS